MREIKKLWTAWLRFGA
jgi:hypothetical protein